MIAKLCPSCHKSNPVSASTCEHCRTQLFDEVTDVTLTRQLPVLQLPTNPNINIRDENVVMLSIIGEDTPLSLHFPFGKMTVGRYAAGSAPPDIDLKELGAEMLGVSRLHALLTRNEYGLFIEDLGSTNGTHLNNQELEPHTPYHLQNNDYVSFGQLIMSVHFASDVVPTETLYLIPATSLSTAATSASIGAYLMILKAIQKILNHQRAKPVELITQNIDLNHDGCVCVEYIGGDEAIKLTFDVIQQWGKDGQAQAQQRSGLLDYFQAQGSIHRYDDAELENLLLLANRLIDSKIQLMLQKPKPVWQL